ncbi:MAG: serine hydrolase [Calditrichaeota bacterium]|nr:serine hydrolase [Calditrichota bacterium]
MINKSLLLLLFFWCSFLYAQLLPVVSPEKAGMDLNQLKRADEIINQAIRDSTIPGAVFLVTRENKVVYRKAYGYRQLLPNKKKMTVKTIFDLASITKPVATATSAMILIDRGKLRLMDRVDRFIPEFSRKNEKDHSGEPIRIIHLLTHTSGLPPYAPVKELAKRFGSPAPDSLITYIARAPRHHEPGVYFKYSCLNYITLQRIIEIISGQSLDDFTRDNIFNPLGMMSTFYNPPKERTEFCAATEILEDGEVLLGKVHDPLARVMNGGVSGNAGLFSTADDLAIYAAMLLNEGSWNGRRILSKPAVRKMISVPRGFEKFGRTLGWDAHSVYNSNMGDLFGDRAFGHTGYTGTSITIDPESKVVVILLTNRVHPHDQGSVVRLRSLIANVVAASVEN